uniref:Uncharacterized protein n=1 Tax=Anopheles atroparvus TaxID=41427 RepID=A0A182JMW7_ANOAO
ANLDGQSKEHHQQAAGSKQHQQQQQHSPQDVTLVPLGSANTNTANSTDSLLGDSRSVAPPNGQNVVSPSVMARFLEDELKSGDALLLGTPIKHCDTCVCTRNVAGGGEGGSGAGVAGINEGSLLLADLLGSEQKYYSVATQTLIRGETNNSLCLRCNSNLNSPSHNNSPYIMKLIKSSDSVISETKSSVSDYLTTPDKVSPTGGANAGAPNGPPIAPSSGDTDSCNDPLATLLLPPTKKDDLMVNPILGHHRLTAHDRSSNGHTGDVLLGKAASTTTAAVTTPTAPYASSKLPSFQPVGKKPSPPPPPPPQPSTKPLGTAQPPTSASTRNESKFAHDSPSYIIKDTDQMSGSHTTPKSTSVGPSVQTVGGGGGAGAKYVGTSASGSVGSGLYHTVGSTNSLWSRTSSKDPEKDGAKMFEIFNRNLIKTIKAENPKMSGPRICALRIQNGSSNILLDNLIDDGLEGLDTKPPTTPVMYTRRAKFLDEELLLDDDPSIGLNGAIKTTNLPTAASSSGDSGVLGKVGETPALLVGVNDVPVTGGAAAGVRVGDAAEGHGCATKRADEGDAPVAGGKQVCNMSTTTSPHSSDRLCTIGEEVSNLLINTKLGPARLDPKPPRLDISVNKLDGLDVTSKKSCTQSSSISSEIDIQESAILRRQQLSRVAEWVQNNSKLGNADSLCHAESDHEQPAASRADTLNNNPPAGAGTVAPLKASSVARPSVLAHTDHSKPTTVPSSTTAMSTAMAGEMRMGRAGVETFARCNNFNNNNNHSQPKNNPPATFAQLAGASHKVAGTGGGKHGYNNALHSSIQPGGGFKHGPGMMMLDYNSNATATAPSPSTGVPFQCPPASSAASGAIRKGSYCTPGRGGAHTECLMETGGGSQPRPPPLPEHDDDDDDDGSSIDLAQMEYNVKQFLLKQNEWSTVHTRRQSLISSTASSVKGRDEPVRQNPPKGLFPGMAVAQTGHGASNYHPVRTGSNKYPINPHRTETNL